MGGTRIDLDAGSPDRVHFHVSAPYHCWENGMPRPMDEEENFALLCGGWTAEGASVPSIQCNLDLRGEVPRGVRALGDETPKHVNHRMRCGHGPQRKGIQSLTAIREGTRDSFVFFCNFAPVALAPVRPTRLVSGRDLAGDFVWKPAFAQVSNHAQISADIQR